MRHSTQSMQDLAHTTLTFSQLPPEHLQLLLRLCQGAERDPAAAQEWGGGGRGWPGSQEGAEPRGHCRQGSTNGFRQGIKLKA